MVDNPNTDGVFDIGDNLFSDNTVDINKYLNVAILTAQKILPNSTLKGSVEEGLLAYSLQVDQAEMFARAGKYLSEEYDKGIDEFKKTKEYTQTKREPVRMAKLANKKLYLLMKEINDNAPSWEPMKY